MRNKNILGQRFERLVVIKKLDSKYYLCRCDCGNEKRIRRDGLTTGNTRSCGCLNREAITKHGLSVKHKRLYDIWGNMKSRCHSPNHRDYHKYGGRGITVCEEWRNDFKKFCEWSLINGFVEGDLSISIDRINNDEGYSPSNCRWTDKKTQNNNRRCNVRTIVLGEELTLKQIADKYDINYETVKSRYRNGLRGEELIKPVKHGGTRTCE